MDASIALRELSQPWSPGIKKDEFIRLASKRAGLSFWRTFDLWYGKARQADEFELKKISAALEKKRKQDARNEFQELKTRMARLEALLARTDPDFFSEEITYTRDHLRRLDGKSSPSNSAVD